MFRTNPLVARLFPKLAYQLLPAALVTTIGVLLLSNLAKAPSAATDMAPVETAINAEAIFKIVPREPAESAGSDTKRDAKRGAASRTAVNPKPFAASAAALQTRKRAEESATPNQVASAPPPLPIVPIPEQPQMAAVKSGGESGFMAKLRSATTAVQGIPKWATHSVAGWFAPDAPPRPPASVPVQNFQASM